MRPAFRAAEEPLAAARQSAVLATIVDGSAGPSIILIERAQGGVHGGQIALPGGAEEQGDDGPEGTALREAREEIGLDSTLIEVMGLLTPLGISVSRYIVQPVLGIARRLPSLTPNAQEVAAILEVGLDALLDPASKAERELEIRGEPRAVPCYLFGTVLVWGATAMMLSELEALIREA